MYHPQSDPFHGVHRLLALLEAGRPDGYLFEAARILDFFILFPHLLGKVRLPAGNAAIRKHAGALQSSYNIIENVQQVFESMQTVQHLSFGILLASGLVEPTGFANGVLFRTTKSLAVPPPTTTSSETEPDVAVRKFVINEMGAWSLTGKNGLKDRTNLMDWHYDVTV